MTWTEVLIGMAAAGGVLFVWNAICWMGLHHHKDDTHPLGAAEEGVAQALREGGVGPGWYLLPHFKNYEGMSDPKLVERMKAGPNASIVVWPPGGMDAGIFLRGLMIDLMEGLGLTVLLLAVSPYYVTELWHSALLMASVGLLISGGVVLAYWNWWKYPLRGALTQLFDKIFGFAIVGAVLHLILL